MEALAARLPLPARIEGLGLDLDTQTWRWSWRFTKWQDFAFQYGLMALYYVSIVVLQRYVDRSKATTGGKYVLPSWYKPVNMVHNLGLCAVSLWLTVTQVRIFYEKGFFESFHTFACAVEPNEGLYGFSSWIFIVSKVWEWIDTYFLIMMGRKIIFLHWFHHMTTMHLFISLSNMPSGKAVWMNALVHVFMYAHYAFPQRWARSFITSSQLIQFIIGLSVHCYLIWTPGCFDWRGKGLHYEAMASFVVVFIFLLEFSRFFHNNYIKAKSSTEKKRQ